MTIAIKLENEQQLLQGIDKLNHKLEQELVGGVNRATAKILRTAQRNAPVRTGELRDSRIHRTCPCAEERSWWDFGCGRDWVWSSSRDSGRVRKRFEANHFPAISHRPAPRWCG